MAADLWPEVGRATLLKHFYKTDLFTLKQHYLHTHIHTYYICVYEYKHAYMHTYTDTYIHSSIHAYIHLYAYMNTYIHVQTSPINPYATNNGEIILIGNCKNTDPVRLQQ